MDDFNRRILVIDDDKEIWRAYRDVLLPMDSEDTPGNQMARLLDPAAAAADSGSPPRFEMSFAPQGQEGFAMVEAGIRDDASYAVAFIDIRMPPGWDGMKTAAEIRRVDPNIEIVIVTAFSDHTQDEIVKVVGAPDKLLFLRKPFDADELKQIAISLIEKWNIGRREEAQRRDLQTILRTTPAAIFTVDCDRIVRSWNPAAERITGYSEVEVFGLPCPFNTTLATGVCRHCLLTDRQSPEIERTREIRFANKNGEMKTILIRLSRILDRNGKFVKAVESFWDITALKEAEIALHDSEERFRALVETTSDMVWEVDGEGLFTYCSPVCEEIYGYRPAELLGTPIFGDLSDSEDRDFFAGLFKACMQSSEGFRSVGRRCRRADGQLVYVDSSAEPVVDGMGKLVGFRGIDRDITGRKKREEEKARLEEQYRQSQKMESLGTLAGGIAHDLNNVLTPIMCNAELTMLLLDPDHPATKKVKDITKCVDRASDLIRKILAFSRKQVLQPTAQDLNGLIDDFSKILRRLIREDIEMVVELDADLLPVSGDAGQLEQILMNLVVNAGDAVSGNGRISIRTSNVTVAPDQLLDVDNKPIVGDFAVLAVSDNGSGMDQETMKRIFEPFFTTKEVGKGTGMGLSTVYGIVQQHKGHLRIETTVGAGTTFYVYLQQTTRRKAPEEKPEGVRDVTGHETILLAEDDPGVRDVAATTLREYGYRVIEAASGGDAVKAFATVGGAIDMLLTDVIMPGIHGDQVAKTIRESKPGLPVLYVSGYTFEMSAKDLENDGNSMFLQKPFRQVVLLQAVRNLLDRSGNDS
ncbi:MAG: PAS domain S-box protein [Desulfobulbaceae bacterium]|nr:PAS domain S-box protein [Desulfobulbaceae bacterium]